MAANNGRPESPVGSPRSASISLQAAATMNAGLQREPSRQSSSSSLARNATPSSPQTGRRRSTVLMNLHLNDPAVPAPGEMMHDPHQPHPNHHRAPSLGELHQELEAEQEAHVNRLLHMIRQQQFELQRLQAGRPAQPSDDDAADRHAPLPSTGSVGTHPRSPLDNLGRADVHNRRSRTPSRGASPRLRAASISADSGDWVLGGRDESAFYQAETQMLVRENQMLRHRIRDLEKQLTDLSVAPTEPAIPSQLTRSSTTTDELDKQSSSSSTSPLFPVSLRADFTHVNGTDTETGQAKVVGGGVVGLAVARQLSLRSNSTSSSSPNTTLLIERHGSLGSETSSRNSEVLHAGLYYGAESLKAKLCVRGQRLVYDFCNRYRVPHRRVGKWIVALDLSQREALEDIYSLATRGLGLTSLRWLSQDEIRSRGEGVYAPAGALESRDTGIVDSHGLMTCLRALFEDRGGTVALMSSVIGVEPIGLRASDGWRLRVRDESSSSPSVTTITTETLINAAGLEAVNVHNLIVPPDERLNPIYFAKGSYFSYAASKPRLSRLIYPAPSPASAGLGTHLTIDLAGQMRFGPDVEWVDSPHDLAVSPDRLSSVARDVRRYLPALDPSRLVPDYAGIRPKLRRGGTATVAGGSNFQDFVIRKDDRYDGWVDLLAIESPGLTSCLAIAEMVEDILYGTVTAAH
ncbi:hypothetical protein CP533_0076 [Ophiocordyceps camponoti-saundersi (nom. inval.)]|nr:hypothetical protein CP533_0076 [Ophiocordyceps camponoti-saundersi (nom. inval.)]